MATASLTQTLSPDARAAAVDDCKRIALAGLYKRYAGEIVPLALECEPVVWRYTPSIAGRRTAIFDTASKLSWVLDPAELEHPICANVALEKLWEALFSDGKPGALPRFAAFVEDVLAPQLPPGFTATVSVDPHLPGAPRIAFARATTSKQ